MHNKKPHLSGLHSLKLKVRGADTENRTRDLTLTKGALYQLSHISTHLVRGGTDGDRTRDLLRDRQAF